ncbi:MAG: HAD family hydrolase [Phycisphaeraceae bacterium]
MSKNNGWLILLDIDGTILTSEGVGPRLMQRAADRLFDGKLRFEGVDFSGNLDPLIVAEAATRSSFDWNQEHHRRFRSAYLDVLSTWLRDSTPELLPGAQALIDSLHQSDVHTGLLTGNYPEAARLKLDAVGLAFDRFQSSAFGDDACDRPGLVAVARDRHEKPLEATRVVVVGDTPRDVHCAKAHGCTSIAVTTGRFNRNQLDAAGADVVLDSLESATPVLAGLGIDLVE